MLSTVLKLQQQAFFRFSLGRKAISNHGFMVAMSPEDTLQIAGKEMSVVRFVCKSLSLANIRLLQSGRASSHVCQLLSGF